MPNIAWAGLAASQVAGDLSPEFGNPATDCLIRNVDTTLEQHFLNFTQAEIEPQVKPNGVSNDLRRKTVTLETDIECLHRRNLQATRNVGNCKPVNVTTPFQSYALWPHMDVAGNVGYPLKVRGISGEGYQVRVAQALAAVHLEAYSDRRPSGLSGGQRQRVALARCLVTQPEVVLLDEPLANLDRHLRQEMEETFREFHKRSGATMIYVTHDQAEAMALASDVAVMSEGRLLQVAPPEEIYARPEGRVVGSLIGQATILSLPAPTALMGRRALDWEFLRNHAGNQPAPGIPVIDVLVRPQDVEIVSEGGVPAVVESATFEGERYVLRLRLADGQTLRAFSRRAARPGEAVRLAIHSGWRL